jgi:predicted Zn-dependent protease
MDNLFSTHPNPKNRIDALMAMARETGGGQGSAGQGPWGGTSAERQGPWG